MRIQEITPYEIKRGDCYRLLAACFYLPQKGLFVEEDLSKNLTMLLKEVCPEAAKFSGRMGDAILNYSEEDLQVEYAHLFVGPYELVAPPYGSVYLDGKKRVMGDSTIEVSRIYKEAGLFVDDDFKELPDHIAVELEFMYYLIFKEVEALEKYEINAALQFIKMQEVFLNKFLRQWVAPFCEKIKEGTENGFYTALADCLKAFIVHSRLPSISDLEGITYGALS